MEQLEAAILRTILYADVFHFAMTLPEIHHFLIHDQPVSREQIETTLNNSAWLRPQIEFQDGYFAYSGHAHLITTRRAREQASQRLWPLARRYATWLSRLPFVRMVALTGALAMRNAAAGDDDLDYLIVTTPNRVWLARAFSIMLVRLARLQGIEICPNYVLAENTLKQERRDIFIAHEVAQMVPLYGYDLYERMRSANDWVTDYMPNAEGTFYRENECQPGRLWGVLKNRVEWLLGGRVGDQMEDWEYRRKLRRFASDMQTPNSSAILDKTQVKGHFKDYGHSVLQQYADRITRSGLESSPLAVPGD